MFSTASCGGGHPHVQPSRGVSNKALIGMGCGWSGLQRGWVPLEIGVVKKPRGEVFSFIESLFLRQRQQHQIFAAAQFIDSFMWLRRLFWGRWSCC